jgi:hypothetical protein
MLTTIQEFKILAVLKYFMFKPVSSSLFYLNLGLFLSMKKRALFNVLKKPEAELNSEVASAQGNQNSSEFEGKLYVGLEDEDINNANRHVIEMKEQVSSISFFRENYNIFHYRRVMKMPSLFKLWTEKF